MKRKRKKLGRWMLYSFSKKNVFVKSWFGDGRVIKPDCAGERSKNKT